MTFKIEIERDEKTGQLWIDVDGEVWRADCVEPFNEWPDESLREGYTADTLRMVGEALKGKPHLLNRVEVK